MASLPRGETQPFYHVLADDGSARYGTDLFGMVLTEQVGEDNIRLLQGGNADAIDRLCGLKDIGRYFSSFASSTGTFTPSPKLALEYPDL